ncbi:MAG: 50S ribosomal protein L9 [Myxococcales bacterium]|nr:50S ribosomal protein L9 [Myxococcales bacterium]USN50101.1 MAG: 50S ribosomal protein L9 [Myxococcales bacterium]
MASRVQAILARDVANLGCVGDIVKVAPGYLRNWLLPQRLAMPVTKSRLVQFEHQKRIIMHQLAKLKANSENIRDRIEVQKFTIEVKAGEQGKLFGSVGARDIEASLKEHGFDVDHRNIKLENGPLKTIGLHEVPVRLEGDVMAKIKVILAAIEEPKPAASDEEGEEVSPQQESANDDSQEAASSEE